MKIKVKKILSISFTLIATALSLVGIALYVNEYVLTDAGLVSPYLPFTLNSNIFLAIVGLIFLIAGSIFMLENKPLPQWLIQLKLAAVTAISVTLITVVTFLAPVWGINDTNIVNYQGANLFLHVLAPAVAIIGFILFDVETKIKWRWTWCSVLPVLIYGGVYAGLIFGMQDTKFDIYNFVHEGNENSVKMVRMAIAIAIMLVGSYVLANIWWAINLASFHLTNKKSDAVEEKETPTSGVTFTTTKAADAAPQKKAAKPVVKQDVKPVTKPVNKVETKPAVKPVIKAESKPATKVEAKPVTKTPSRPTSASYNGGVRVYHISTTKSLLGKWQVKLAGGEKAIKVFATQEEAIHYTRGLVATQGGSIRLHSLDGRIRKI